MLKLYYAANTCALATHIALRDAGAEFDLVRVDFAAQDQQKPAYLAVNPKGRVPALATPQGVLTETPALLAWVAQSYSGEGLAPTDPFGFARAQAFNSYLCSTVHVAHAHRMRGHRWADDPAAIAEMQRKVPESVTKAFALIEDELLEGPFVLGAEYSICDPYLFTLAQWLELDGVDISRLPRVMAHRRMMTSRATVQQAIASEIGASPPPP